MKLNNKNLDQINPVVKRPAYDRSSVTPGIVHIGVGAFHRAHQAYYTDKLMQQNEAFDWGFCGAGLRPEDKKVKSALAQQDYLYTLYELADSDDKEVVVVGAIKDFILAETELQRLLTTMASEQIRIVSLTITEGGYFTDDSTGKFLSEHPEILHDVNFPDRPMTVFGVIAEALRRRKENGVAPFTVMSCDNLPHNGEVAKNALLSFTSLQDPDLKQWIETHVTFPNAMVDRITPVTSAEHRQQLADKFDVEDEWPVVCEPFIQWVVEDKFCNGRPAWENVGVQFTDDVTPYETMKIGLLNGSHLALTYLGTLLGYQYAHQTMEDENIRLFVREFMDKDVTPLLKPAPGIDFDEYKDTLIERFSNTEICDQLTRICSDGSSKFPKFIFPTLKGLIRDEQSLDRVSLIVAAWCHYLRGVDESGALYNILDPRLDKLQSVCRKSGDITEEFLGFYEIFGSDIPQSQAFVDSFNRQLHNLRTIGVTKTIQSVLNKKV
ncbi:Mannitol 2-dehydrogenase [Thalassocella blandensis]|nr:Mannitol 2-dehydrogenase [Thalassocella blandensis]